MIAICPSENVVAAGGFAAAGFDERQAGEQTPIQTVSVRFADECGCEVEDRGFGFTQEPDQASEPGIILHAVGVGNGLIGLRNACGNAYKSGHHHQALLNVFFQLEEPLSNRILPLLARKKFARSRNGQRTRRESDAYEKTIGSVYHRGRLFQRNFRDGKLLIIN